ncbi:MAG: GAF domain-containing SpoIIE family protein phosphatase [Acidobacteriota bacterium]
MASDSVLPGSKARKVRRASSASLPSRLGLVSKVTDRLVQSLDFDQALQTLIDGATELLNVERASILILDRETQTLAIRVAKGLSPEVMAATRIPLGYGIAGGVAETQEAVAVRDVRELAGWRRNSAADRTSEYADFSALCVPLVIHGETQGVMNFNHKRDAKPFGQADLEFALLIANQAAIVLYCAMLHRQYLSKQSIEQELRLARSIQERLAPQTAPSLRGFRFAALSAMCQHVGGDYYDFVPLDADRLAIVIGDAAGHGVGSALLATEARAALHQCLSRGDSVEICLQHVNDLLQGDTGAEMYMTLLLGVLDARTHRFTFATAGHHMPLLVRRGRVERLPFAGSNIPLGIRHGLRFALEDPLELEHGDLLLLFTDGVWEATDAEGRRFGTSGLESLLRRCHDRPEEEILREILDRVADYQIAPESEDDCTLVLIRRA